MNIRNVLIFAAVLLAASTASARKTGNTYGLATGCTGCHGGGGAVAPTIEVTQVTTDPLTEGGSVIFNIKITSNTPPVVDVVRGAAFAASVTDDAGQFVDGAETELCVVGGAAAVSCPVGKTAIRDVTRRAFVNNIREWEIELGALGAGAFTLAVGANDVNSNDANGGGDENGNVTLAFTVPGAGGEGEGEGEGEGDPPIGEGEGEGEGEAGEGEGEAGEGEGEGEEGEGEAGGEGEGEGGDGGGGCCSLTGASPASSVGLVVLLALLRRRRGR